MDPKMESLFSRIWSKMASKSDVDPKMAPKDARGPQDGPPRPNMTQKWSKNDPTWLKNGPQNGPNITQTLHLISRHGGGVCEAAV